jgi:predicted patatin/cPLA2 family phospholipase
MKRALVLSGGAFRGAVQVPVLEELIKQHEYDAVYGVSVGAINGVMFAQKSILELRKLWEDIDGINGFLRMTLWPFDGVYSMAPLRSKLEEFVSLKKLKIPFTAGIVSLTNKNYYNLHSVDMQHDIQLWDAVQASASIAGIMKSVTIELEGKLHVCADGGHRQITPTPGGMWDFIDVVSCTPLDRAVDRSPKTWNTLNLAMRGLEILEDEVFDKDYPDLGKHLSPKGILSVYAPKEPVGGPFEANREMIQERFRLGREALRSPIRLQKKDLKSIDGASDLIRL